ncbi:MAG: hypothetical protein J3R72DRAFT_183818, partial [Linnemannia gamsii]
FEEWQPPFSSFFFFFSLSKHTHPDYNNTNQQSHMDATTTTTTTTTVRSPFDLPELRHRLSRFLPLKDSLSCALVSKAWTLDFVSAIWFKVDLSVHQRFTDLPTDVIAKHGHLIRVVQNAKIFSQVCALDHPNINKLRILHMETTGSIKQHGHAFQIVTRNNASLQVVRVSASYTRPDKINNANYHVSVPAFLPSPSAFPVRPSSTIETLEFVIMWMTHDDLMTILEASPRLSKLKLVHTDVVGTPTRFFQHTGVTVLSTSLKSIFPDVPTGLPSLLSYFPNLTTLHTWHWDSSAMTPSARIKKDFERYCPLLKQFKLGDNKDNRIMIFVTDVVSNITRITLQEARMTPNFVAAIVLHQASMEKVAQLYTRGFDYEKEEVPWLQDKNYLCDSQRIQEIPRKCFQLQKLNLHQHEMRMDVVESGEWVCKDLRKLRIRVKGLDTKEKILRTIALWRAGCWRRWQEQATGVKVAVQEEDRLKADKSIEARVARHLLKFEQLWWVWLGYQTWTPI